MPALLRETLDQALLPHVLTSISPPFQIFSLSHTVGFFLACVCQHEGSCLGGRLIHFLPFSTSVLGDHIPNSHEHLFRCILTHVWSGDWFYRQGPRFDTHLFSFVSWRTRPQLQLEIQTCFVVPFNCESFNKRKRRREQVVIWGVVVPTIPRIDLFDGRNDRQRLLCSLGMETINSCQLLDLILHHITSLLRFKGSLSQYSIFTEVLSTEEEFRTNTTVLEYPPTKYARSYITALYAFAGTSSSSHTMSSAGDVATTFDTLALGRAVKLGELYDARSANFLGVQLYDEATMKKKTHSMDIKSTDLSLQMANSFEEKASVLDIHASLSLEILGGLIKVSGSASYLKDQSSNTRESAWSMSLKMRLTEKRLLFAEEDLWLHALESVKLEYIAKRRVTHFVSSIKLGGRVVISLVARSSKVSEEEIISGKLHASLDKLLGVVKLEGEVSAEIKGQFNDIKDKFQVQMHGDIDLETVPVDPAGVLDAFRDARRLLGVGVPISITLQPIPEKLYEESIILHNLDKQRLRDILQAFGNLDDVRSRFQVLQTSVKAYKDTVPELALAINNAASEFANKSQSLSQKLTDALGAFRKDGSESGWGFIQEARTLFNEHIQAAEGYQAPDYPDKLAGLELAYADFGDFVTLMGDLKLPLSVIRDVVRAITIKQTLALFLMPPLNGSVTTNQLFSSLARSGHQYYSNQAISDYFLYLERPENLEKRLPNNGAFAKVTEPSLFLATKAEDGSISWRLVPFAELAPPKRLYDVRLGLINLWSSQSIYHKLDHVVGNESFTIVAKAQATSNKSDPSQTTFFTIGNDTKDFLAMRRRTVNGAMDIYITDGIGHWVPLVTSSLAQGTDAFSAAWVQDVTARKWRFYINGKVIGESAIRRTLGKLSIRIMVGNNKDGSQWLYYVDSIQVYSGALNPAELQLASAAPSSSRDVDIEAIAKEEKSLANSTVKLDSPAAEPKDVPEVVQTPAA